MNFDLQQLCKTSRGLTKPKILVHHGRNEVRIHEVKLHAGIDGQSLTSASLAGKALT